MKTNDDQIVLLSDAIDSSVLKGERYKTGFSPLDEAMRGGYKDGDLVIISGKSGEGKTSISQTLTKKLIDQSLSVLWFSYEVTKEALHEKFQMMGMKDNYIVYTPKQNTTGHLKWVKDKIIESAEKYYTKFVFIDHIDFLVPSSAGRTTDNTASYLKLITTELKALAIELKIVIFCMAHLKKLSHDVEPTMEDIGYSSGIYQLADYVMMIHRETTQKALSFGEPFVDKTKTHTNNSIFKIVKNRETGDNRILKLTMENNTFKLYGGKN